MKHASMKAQATARKILSELGFEAAIEYGRSGQESWVLLGSTDEIEIELECPAADNIQEECGCYDICPGCVEGMVAAPTQDVIVILDAIANIIDEEWNNAEDIDKPYPGCK